FSSLVVPPCGMDDSPEKPPYQGGRRGGPSGFQCRVRHNTSPCTPFEGGIIFIYWWCRLAAWMALLFFLNGSMQSSSATKRANLLSGSVGLFLFSLSNAIRDCQIRLGKTPHSHT